MLEGLIGSRSVAHPRGRPKDNRTTRALTGVARRCYSERTASEACAVHGRVVLSVAVAQRPLDPGLNSAHGFAERAHGLLTRCVCPASVAGVAEDRSGPTGPLHPELV